ncbi:D-alanyl-D-alanine carboxypeptidase family protein [Actinomadura rupiterrae]|uniref:D-alanyl-D-alanine carboxypeptidase family protein n=1 Tax=Actinomadura rupiterrae TaxID=559627 RepID=UPI0020A36F9D|nr:serine hydrolase [Actinomadura rupiterrae]MCP2338379.1 D-alanyl-D-alanine carboxypeptidase (penicillin-binding protein 5/6) [Actinomadura rupiterrae]
MSLVDALPAASAGVVPSDAGTAETQLSGVSAKGAYLVSGRGAWGRSADVRRPIASVTKLMTALVVVRSGDLGRTITIKQKYLDYGVRHGASMAGLRAGDRLTARQLLYAMLLPSGSDAAYALAESYGPTWPKFVAKMNATAMQIGMSSTRYDNFDGLPWPSNSADSSTPRDLVKLAREALTDPIVRRVVGTRTYGLAKSRSRSAYGWTNTNRLLGSYKGAGGVKTGFTNSAGYCLLFTAERGARNVYGVVLGEPSSAARFTDAARMLDWGFGLRSRTIPQFRASSADRD